MKRVSVVVPTYKRPDYLERCLRALLAQDFPPADYEIIIVDDANSSQTRQQVEDWSARKADEGYTIRYLALTGELTPLPHNSDGIARAHQASGTASSQSSPTVPAKVTSKIAHGPAAARNIGWRAAQSDIIAFTDDDCIPEQRWLSAALAAFSDDIAAISGRIVIPMTTTPTDYEYNAYQLTRSEFVTANCFYRRSVLLQVGGFDERFTAAWREDSDLYFTLLEHNFHCIALTEAVVMHPVRPARWGISLSQQRKSMFNALLYKKHPALYRQKVQKRPPWHYYSILGALLVAIGAGIAGFWLLCLAAIAAWLYMTLRFCLQRLSKTIHTPSHIAEMLVTSALIPPLAIFWRIYGMLKFRVLFL